MTTSLTSWREERKKYSPQTNTGTSSRQYSEHNGFTVRRILSENFIHLLLQIDLLDRFGAMSIKDIFYSQPYRDETYEYRHVILPIEQAQLVPRTHLLTETEWRNLGRSIDRDFSSWIVSVSKDCKCLPDGCIICFIILVSQRITEYARIQLDPSFTSLGWFLTLEPQVLLFRRLLQEEWWILRNNLRYYSTVTASCLLFVHWFIRQMKLDFTIK